MDNRIKIISKEQTKKLEEFAAEKKNVLQPFQINMISPQHKVSMILALMISENNVCGSVFLEDFNEEGNWLLISTNDKSNLETTARTILNEIKDFIDLWKEEENFSFIEIHHARNRIIKRAIMRFKKHLNSGATSIIFENFINNANSIFSQDARKIEHLNCFVRSLEKVQNDIRNSNLTRNYSIDSVKISDLNIENFLNDSSNLMKEIKSVENYKNDEELIKIISLFADIYGAKYLIDSIERRTQERRTREWEPIISAIENNRLIFPNLVSNPNNNKNILCLHAEQKKIEYYGDGHNNLKRFILRILQNDAYFGISKTCCFPCHLKLLSITEVFGENKNLIDKLGCSGTCFKSTRYPIVVQRTAHPIINRVRINLKDIGKSCHKEEFPFNECFYAYIFDICDLADIADRNVICQNIL